jgi:hypothetical protein
MPGRRAQWRARLPCPHPSAATSTILRARHFSNRPLVPRCHPGPAAQAATLAASSGHRFSDAHGRAGVLARGLDHQASERIAPAMPGHWIAEQQVALAAAFLSILRAVHVPSEGQRSPPALPRDGGNRRLAIDAEHAIEKARGVRAHELAAQLSRVGHGVRCISRRARRRATLAHQRIGQERRGHHRFDRRCRIAS